MLFRWLWLNAEAARGKWLPQLVQLYQMVYAEAPYFQPLEQARRFGTALQEYTRRKNFRCRLLLIHGVLAGLAMGADSSPGQWWYEAAAEAVGGALAAEWFTDCFELIELMLLPPYRGQGLGARLHDDILEDLPHATAVLNAVEGAYPALALYQRRGWVTLRRGVTYPGFNKSCVIMARSLKQPDLDHLHV